MATTRSSFSSTFMPRTPPLVRDAERRSAIPKPGLGWKRLELAWAPTLVQSVGVARIGGLTLHMTSTPRAAAVGVGRAGPGAGAGWASGPAWATVR